jgi:hypothetical protein
MINIRVFEKNFALVLKHAETLPARIDAAAGKGLALGLDYAVSVSQEQYLSGPRPAKLDVRSTRLRNSIVSKVERFAAGWRGRIGTNVPYGAYHEFGFHGTIQVAAHTRIPKVFSLLTGKTAEFRQSFRDRNGAFIGFKESTARALQRVRKEIVFAPSQTVKAHSRQVNYAGRPFVKPALEQSLPVILRSIESELAKLN